MAASGPEEGRTMTITAPGNAEPAQLTDRELQARITGPEARCVAAVSDPDEWFPVTSEPTSARAQSSHALALCAVCAVRAECLELALRRWADAGRHGIWGGTLESQRRELHRQWVSGLSVTELLGRGS
jgi:Transcription factor WhiB